MTPVTERMWDLILDITEIMTKNIHWGKIRKSEDSIQGRNTGGEYRWISSLLLFSSFLISLGNWSMSYFQLISLSMTQFDMFWISYLDTENFSIISDLISLNLTRLSSFSFFCNSTVLITQAQSHWLFLCLHISLCLAVAIATLFWIVSRSREKKRFLIKWAHICRASVVDRRK